ncbi:DUF1294 domain-containing protein [Xylanibacter rodentium]|uniref:DUF1294 domain-containing protein n=1 Tax=Xylanibacter rodentium TaxID=2736289 RepID=A0ABX2ATM1_9BACT|nr:DUF1294 domain-containing protein [Xylanibacter rodentium]NPE10382.1 DUF1294 domain-containing protein [Prevotella sp. PJ1A]NPE13023.1 DUF1294 domain-containing protein [Xylanibacter rodentium]NPE39269.1 DUF1294 domain-containing protein [Prevotella sp. PCJ2]
MTDYHLFIAIYIIAVNLVTFVTYGIDKYKSIKRKWRISEATLLTMAVIGGSIGAWTGMKVWRHKTMHKKFTIGIPIVFVIHLFIVIYLHTIT